MSRDVVAVSLATFKVRFVVAGKSKQDAEAIVRTAVARRGCTDEFFADVPSALYNEGDVWFGTGECGL